MGRCNACDRDMGPDSEGQVCGCTDLVFEVHTFPMLDTGIGQEAGYANDKEFMAAMEAKRAALPAWQRDIMDDIDRRLDREMLGGD